MMGYYGLNDRIRTFMSNRCSWELVHPCQCAIGDPKRPNDVQEELGDSGNLHLQTLSELKAFEVNTVR